MREIHVDDYMPWLGKLAEECGAKASGGINWTWYEFYRASDIPVFEARLREMGWNPEGLVRKPWRDDLTWAGAFRMHN